VVNSDGSLTFEIKFNVPFFFRAYSANLIPTTIPTIKIINANAFAKID